jgi:AcrR family transcriptional regulator
MNTKSPQRRGHLFVQSVLRATLVELARVGLEALSVAKIAELAGANKTSIYRRWPTKQDLILAALADQTVNPPIDIDTGSFIGDLSALAVELGQFAASPIGKGLLKTLIAESESLELRNLFSSMQKNMSKKIPTLAIERGRARGEVKGKVDAETLMLALAGAVLHRTFIERKTVSKKWANRLCSLLVYGVSGR